MSTPLIIINNGLVSSKHKDVPTVTKTIVDFLDFKISEGENLVVDSKSNYLHTSCSLGCNRLSKEYKAMFEKPRGMIGRSRCRHKYHATCLKWAYLQKLSPGTFVKVNKTEDTLCTEVSAYLGKYLRSDGSLVDSVRTIPPDFCWVCQCGRGVEIIKKIKELLPYPNIEEYLFLDPYSGSLNLRPHFLNHHLDVLSKICKYGDVIDLSGDHAEDLRILNSEGVWVKFEKDGNDFFVPTEYVENRGTEYYNMLSDLVCT